MSSQSSGRSSSRQSNSRQSSHAGEKSRSSSSQSNSRHSSSSSSSGNSGGGVSRAAIPSRVPDRHSSSGSSDSGQSRQRSDEDLEKDVYSSSSLSLPSIYEKGDVANVIPIPPPPPPPPPLRVTKEVSFVRMVKEGNRPSPDQTQPSQTTGESTGDDPQSLKDAFMHLLTNRGYKERAKLMKILVDTGANTKDCYTLKVNFLDLLHHRRYMPLALKCSKDLTEGDKEHGWLQPTAQEFLNTEFKLKDADISNLRFEFLYEAKSVKMFKDYPSTVLVKKAKIFGNAYDEQRKTTFAGRQIYFAVTRHVNQENRKGSSWRGRFKADDIYIIKHQSGAYECIIMSEDKVISSNTADRVSDLQRVDELITPSYKLEGMYPAYFDELHKDYVNLTEQKVRDTCFLDYLPFHVALMTPAARRTLLEELYMFAQSRTLNSEAMAEFELAFLKAFSKQKDWRVPLRSTNDPILKGVFYHDSEDKDDKKKGKDQKEEKDQKEDKFKRTALGYLNCSRNVVKHAHNHFQGIYDQDDSELFQAWKFPDMLPQIMRNLFCTKRMRLKKELASVWAHYIHAWNVNDD